MSSYGMRIKSTSGKTIYDSTLRNYCFIGKKTVSLPTLSDETPYSAVVDVPNPATTACFVRVDAPFSGAFQRYSLYAEISGSQMVLLWMGFPELVTAHVYFMGVGTTGIKPKYGAVAYDDKGNVTWSSQDTPLFVRRANIPAQAATPGSQLISGIPCAVIPSVTGWATRGGLNGGSITHNVVGFSNGIYTGGMGNFNGSGDWTFADSLVPHSQYQPYIDTSILD